MSESLLDARHRSLETLIAQAETLLSGIEDHVEEYGDTLLYEDDCEITCEHSARHQLRGSVLFCLRKAKVREPRVPPLGLSSARRASGASQGGVDD